MVFNYFRFELKNCIKIIGKSAVSLLLVIAAVIALIFGCSYFFLHSSVFNVIDVAIVLPEEKNDSKWALDFLLATESVKSVCNIVYYDRQENAMEALEQGNVKAIISLPANFYEDVDTGVNTPVSIFVPEHASLQTEVFIDLIGDAVKMLQISEAGVYSTLDIAREQFKGQRVGKLGDEIAILYIVAVLDRNLTFDKKIVSATGDINMYQYYASVFLILLLMLFCSNFWHMYDRKNKALEQKLTVYGVGIVKQSMIRVFIMTITMWIISMVVYLLYYFGAKLLKFEFIEMRSGTIIGLLIISFAIAALMHLLLSIVGGSEFVAGGFYAVNIMLVICSGTIIPAAYYPAVIQKLVPYIPVAMWNDYAISSMFDQVNILFSTIICLIAIIEFVIGTVILCKKK